MAGDFCGPAGEQRDLDVEIMSLYANKSETARFFGISRTKLYKALEGIQDEMEAGRYSQYSMAGSLVNKAVVLDYLRFGEMLRNKNTREYTPPYDEQAAIRAVGEMGEKHERKKSTRV